MEATKNLICRYLNAHMNMEFSIDNAETYEIGLYISLTVNDEVVKIFIVSKDHYNHDVVKQVIGELACSNTIIMSELCMNDKRWIHMLESMVQYFDEKYP